MCGSHPHPCPRPRARGARRSSAHVCDDADRGRRGLPDGVDGAVGGRLAHGHARRGARARVRGLRAVASLRGAPCVCAGHRQDPRARGLHERGGARAGRAGDDGGGRVAFAAPGVDRFRGFAAGGRARPVRQPRQLPPAASELPRRDRSTWTRARARARGARARGARARGARARGARARGARARGARARGARARGAPSTRSTTTTIEPRCCTWLPMR